MKPLGLVSLRKPQRARFEYNANGNLTGDGTKTYEWDAANRVTRVSQGATELARFTYDGLGRRAQKVDSVGGVTHTYIYDGPNIIEERLSSGQTYDYVQGPGIDRPLAMRDQAGVVSYCLADHIGSIVQTTSSIGAVSVTREYDPWGNAVQGSSTAAGFSYTGREWGPESGLYYYRARYYDPKIGRFLSEDPIGLGGGANFYRYVGNNPTTWTDPLGLYKCYYYTANHVLVCEPDDPTNPWYVTANITSGTNGPENRRKHYSECDDCQDNPRRTNRSGRGPIPEGTYNIGSMGSNGWRFLNPDPIPRTGFYTHFCRNRLTCSEGCVAFTNFQEFAEFNRLMNLEPNNTLTVRWGGRRHTRCGCD